MRTPRARAAAVLDDATAPGAALLRNSRSIALMAIVLAAFALLWPTTASLVETWRDDVVRTYGHGFFIVALSLWMLWRQRRHIAQVEAAPLPWMLVVLAIASLAWLIALRAAMQIVGQALLPLMIMMAASACFGWKVFSRCWLALAFLYFAIPIWDAVNPLLQWASVIAVRVLLRLASVPAYFDGYAFEIPAGTLEVADGCSGLNFLVVALAISVVYGELNRDSWRVRLQLAALAALLAMVTNWLRVFLLVVVAHVTDMQHYLISQEHYSFGWVMFAGTMLIYFLIVRRWNVEAASAEARAETAARTPLKWVAAAVGTLAVGPVWYVLDHNRAEVLPSWPERVPGWMATAQIPGEWRPIFHEADREERVVYRSQDREIEGVVISYADQRQGKELVGYGNSPLGNGFSASGPARIIDRHWYELPANDAAGGRWLVRYAYRVDDLWYAASMKMQLVYGWRSLVSAPVSRVYVFRTACSSDCVMASAHLTQFVNAAFGTEEKR